MGLLSKIFNTNKLAYILREEEEFSVTAPKQWNVETLTVGDTITPNMFKNQYKYYNFDLYIKEIGYDDNYLDDPESAGYYVITEFGDSVEGNLKYLDNQLTWGLGEINKYLKPKYKVVTTDLSESEDEFNVDAPEEWNIEYLSIGDQITPDMWNQESKLIWDLLDTDINKTYKIIGFFEEWDGYEEQEDFDPIFVELEDEVGHISTESLTVLQGSLKPEFKITQNKNLNEVEDEFNVAAPPEWNVEELGVGDLITPENSTTGNYYLIKRIVGDSVYVRKGTLDYNGEFMPQHSIDFHAGLRNLQSRLKPGFKITQNKNLNEVEDEFNVDAPEDWNIIELGVGDQITPDMWQSKQYDLNIQGKTAEITDIGVDDKGPYVVLAHNNPYWSLDYDIDVINDLLKPQYKIEQNLIESDEDFNVDAPAEWDITELKKGDYIMPDMWVKDIDDFFTGQSESKYLFKQLTSKPIKITGVMRGDELYFEVAGLYFILTNDFLLPQYKVVGDFGMYESNEDEFNVDAPSEWDVTELSKGDIITPDMWKDDLINWMKKFEIVDFKVSLFPWGHNEAVLKVFQLKDEPIPGTNRTTRQWKYIRNIFVDIETLNDRLKDNFIITPSLRESENEFSVDAPQEWNVEYLTTGDTITPDMWDQNKIGRRKDFFSKPIKIDSIGYNEFDNEEEEPLVGLDLGDTTTEYDIDFVNYLLKPEFKVVQNKNLTEEEDFNVDAPAEWNRHELKVGDYFDDYIGEVYTREEDIPKDSRGFTYEIIYIGSNEGEYRKSAYYDHNIIAFRRVSNKNQIYSFTVEHFNNTRGPKLNAYINLPNRFNLNEDEENFNVDAPKSWNINYLNVGDTITPNMWNKRETKQSTFDFSFNKPLKINWIGSDGIENFIVFEESDLVTYAVEDIHDLLKPEYRISLSNLQESEENFNVDALPEWDVIELRVGDYINSNMLNPKGNDYTWFSRRKLFIEDIYFDECWTVNLLHVESGYHTPFCIDYINEDVLNDKYRIMTSLNELLEIDDEFDVKAPQKWDVIELGVGDKITRDMIKNPIFLEQMDEDFRMDFPGVITKIYLAGPTDDAKFWGVRIKFQDIGWRKYLPQSKDIKLGLGFSLDGFNENTLKPQYQIQKPVFELSKLLENEEDFNVNAPDEWNVELLTVGDTVTPEMWGYEQINSWFDISKPLNIEDIGEDDGGWWVQLGRNEAPFDLDEVNEFLKPQYKIVPYNLEESDDEFSVNAPEEWNYDYWEPTKGMREDEYYKSFDEFVTRILRKYGVEDEFIEVYLDEVFNFGDFGNYEGISSGDLYEDFQQWIRAQDETSEWYDDMNEEEDFSVDAPKDWWEYDGDVELMFQDTYWYEDENGKEAIVERDGGGIVNINDLEQYSYSDWKPFTGNPTSENLTKWYYSINWDTDLVEMFDFDDSLFEVEEDFDWSTAENIDMDRTGFKIRAVSTLKEADDEFTVKAPQKWDIVYLNKGDFLDNTNSTFNDPNVKYEIGNITSDGEIEVKKYINRGSGFEPQFDRFMKTRKGIVKAKLKPGFDIEAFSK